VRFVLTIFFLLVLMPTASLARSDEQLQECIGALNKIAQVIDRDHPNLNSDYVRALYGRVLLDRVLVTGDDWAGNRDAVGDESKIRGCSSVGVSKKNLEILLKAYHGQLSNDPAEDLAHCYAFVLHVERDKALGKYFSRQVGAQLGYELGEVRAFVTHLYREPTVWETEKRGEEIAETHSANQMANSESICEWYSIPVSAVKIATLLTLRAVSRQQESGFSGADLNLDDIPAEDLAVLSKHLRENNIPVTAGNLIKLYNQVKD